VPSLPLSRWSACLVRALLVALLGASAAAQSHSTAPPAARPDPDAPGLVRRAGERIAALQREADQLAKQSKTTLAALRQLELTRALRAEELAAVNVRLEAVSAKVAASTARVHALEQQRMERTPALEERLQALYKRGRNGYVRLLLDTDDERDLARASRGVVSLARIEEIRIAEHRRLLTEEQAARAQLQSEERQVARLRAEAVNLEAAAGRAVADRSKLLDDLDRRRELAAAYVGELEQARTRLQSTLSGLPADAPVVDLPLRPFQGELPWPITGPILSRFGRSATGSYGTIIQRNGIEIGATVGAPVKAVHGGTVAYAAPFTGYGVMVILDHGENAFTVYGHLSGTALRPGATVARSQLVGTAGSTPAGAPATYFEVRIDGRPVNPLQWIAAGGGRLAARQEP
jgi:septal ring factor EnvC (AmiA/AmiB activator)